MWTAVRTRSRTLSLEVCGPKGPGKEPSVLRSSSSAAAVETPLPLLEGASPVASEARTAARVGTERMWQTPWDWEGCGPAGWIGYVAGV